MAEGATAPRTRRLDRLVSHRDHWPLVLSAGGVIAIAADTTTHVPVSLAAALLGTACFAAGPAFAYAIVVVAANDVHLFRDPALGSLTAVDVAILATVCRAAVTATRRRLSALEFCAVGFLIAAAVSTLIEHHDSAVTAYGRVASYLVLGLIVGRALTPGDRPRIARAFVGAGIGQVAAALLGITPTLATSFPIGRYLGTLGDPAQFGIPVAVAAVLVIASPHIIRSDRARYGCAGLLCIGVLGSVTRSAWSVLGAGLLLMMFVRIGRGRLTVVRAALGLALLAVAAVATVVVIFGAATLGLTQQSGAIRARSIESAARYLTHHPLAPTGLGNTDIVIREPVTRVSPILASNFERSTSGWTTFHNARIARTHRSAVSGDASLKVFTQGRSRNEGIQSPPIGGIRSNAPYAISLSGKIPKGVHLWLYADEYTLADHWITYKYTVLSGSGIWKRYSWTLTTEPATAHLRLYVVTPSETTTSFLVDAAQLDIGPKEERFIGREKEPLTILRVAGVYNTWLAVAIQLGIVAAVLLLVLAVIAPYHAYRLGDRGTGFALAALLVPSITEDFVYGGSLVTLIWLAGIGLAVTANNVLPRLGSQAEATVGPRDGPSEGREASTP